MQTYTDEYIDFWGDIYTANPALFQRGILFHAFLEAPVELLTAVYQQTALPLQDDEDFYPLLPAQQRVSDRLMAEEIADELEQYIERQEGLVFRNGAYVEPLRHHAYPNTNKMRRVV